LFFIVPVSRLAVGIRVGLLTAATTAGVIVGLGLRQRAALEPFLMTGRAALSGTAGLGVPGAFATMFGVIVHVVWMLVWGVCFSIIATPLRGAQRLAVAIAVAALAGLLSATIAPGAMGAGALAVQTRPQTIFLLVLFTASLLFGIRLART
jgi:hypothetical protein